MEGFSNPVVGQFELAKIEGDDSHDLTPRFPAAQHRQGRLSSSGTEGSPAKSNPPEPLNKSRTGARPLDDDLFPGFGRRGCGFGRRRSVGLYVIFPLCPAPTQIQSSSAAISSSDQM